MRTNLLLIGILISSLLTGCFEDKETPKVSTQVSTEATPQESQKPAETQVPLCDDHKYCASLREFEKKCSETKKESDCKQFVDAFSKLAQTKDCKRSFDTSPVSSVWLCDEDEEETAYPKIFERSAKTLSKLKFPFARKFYGSEDFRSTLDGAVAEEHFDNSVKAGSSKSK